MCAFEVFRSRKADGVERRTEGGTEHEEEAPRSLSAPSPSSPSQTVTQLPNQLFFVSPHISLSRMTSPSTLIPLLLRHSLPHIPSHGFSLESLSLASLSLPPPYHYSNALNSAGISTLFGPGREPQRALVKEWLMDKRGEMQREWKGKQKEEGKVSSTSLQEILESRLEMNDQVRPWLAEVSFSPPGPSYLSLIFTQQHVPLISNADQRIVSICGQAFALFSITSTPLPLVGVGLKTPFPLLNHCGFLSSTRFHLTPRYLH